MNIFYLDRDPSTCAQQHCDKHTVKMVVEYAQLLSTAHRVLDGVCVPSHSKSGRSVKRFVLPDRRDSDLYIATHANHPSAQWCRRTESNYRWLYELWRELMSEYTHRYDRTHACERLIPSLRQVPWRIGEMPFEDPPQAMPDDCKLDDAVLAYQKLYTTHKKHFCSWKRRPVPEWFITK